MARDTIDFLENVVGGPATLVGYSAGGTVALRVALLRPDLTEKLVLISAAFDPDGLIFKPSAGGELPEQILDAYAEVSPDGYCAAGSKRVRSDKEECSSGSTRNGPRSRCEPSPAATNRR